MKAQKNNNLYFKKLQHRRILTLGSSGFQLQRDSGSIPVDLKIIFLFCSTEKKFVRSSLTFLKSCT